MIVNEEFVSVLLDKIGKLKNQDSKKHEEWFQRCCQNDGSNPIKVFSEFIRYSECWGFPEEEDECARKFVESGNAEELTTALFNFKYPDLQKIFALKIVLGGKGVQVLGQLYSMDASLCRDTAIYAILYNAFYHDHNIGTFELPNYFGIGNPDWFVRLFFNELYRYDGVYKEEVFATN